MKSEWLERLNCYFWVCLWFAEAIEEKVYDCFCNTGAGESGKSTILKQMKLIHASGFSKSDRDDYRGIIFSNLLTSLKVILEAMEGYDIKFENKDNEVLQDIHI